MKRPDSATGTGELEEERDFLLRSLDDLDRERAAGDLDPADYVALKEDYTARAAAVLRAIDHGAGRGAPSEPATPARDDTEPATPARDHIQPATPARDDTEPAAPARDDTEPATPARAATGAQPDWARYGTPLPARRARAGTRTVPRKTAPRAAPTASRRLRPWLVGAGASSTR